MPVAVPGRVTLERTWLDRFLKRPSQVITLDRDIGGLIATQPYALPLEYQTALPPDHSAHLAPIRPYPLGPLFPRFARSFQLGVDDDDYPGLDHNPPPAVSARPVLVVSNRARHTNFQATAPLGVDTGLLPDDPWRTYLLIVNNSANNALIGFDKASIPDGLVLASGGGFIELRDGTISSVSFSGVGGPATLSVVEGRSVPAEACVLDCVGVDVNPS